MDTVFLICFGIGIGYVLIGFILGEVFGVLDLDIFDADVGFDGLMSPLKPSVIAAFLIVFGAVGLISISRFSAFSAFFLALLCGFCVAYLFMQFIIKPLYKAQNGNAIEKQKLIGKNATVTEFIPQGGYGKITYYANDNTYSSPAKSEDGTEIKRNEVVEITCIEKNTYFVRKKGI